MRVQARRVRQIAGGLALGVAMANAAAYGHAHAFTHFSAASSRTRSGQLLSLGERLQALAPGVGLPRPENHRTPADLGLRYERHVFAGARGVPLEAWLVPRPNARGTAVLFHGHASSKDALLREAKVFHGMGLNAFLVDFYGSGGSGGNETSIGYHEAIDVARAFDYVRGLPAPGQVVLYGTSMGAAAILKGVADDHLHPAGLILECPFHSLIGTVRNRFTRLGLPSFPCADLLVFWGGVQQGYNGFRYRPMDDATLIDRPTLLMSGERDRSVTPEDTRAILDALRGPKTLQLFPGVGHDSCLRGDAESWKQVVSMFLDEVLGPATLP